LNASIQVFYWRDYLPLAKAETSKFYRNQERGRFRYEELLSFSVEALGSSPGVIYAVKAIRGALLDYARDSHKLVHNVEMSEDEYHRTSGSPVEKKDPKPKVRRKFFKEHDVWGTLYSPGPHRSNEQLLQGDGKVGKHGKVSVGHRHVNEFGAAERLNGRHVDLP
jgi:hypothetical protein